MTEKTQTTELKSRGEEMEYGTARKSTRAARRQKLQWRMFDAKRATYRYLAAMKRQARLNLNLENKPLGA